MLLQPTLDAWSQSTLVISVVERGLLTASQGCCRVRLSDHSFDHRDDDACPNGDVYHQLEPWMTSLSPITVEVLVHASPA